MKMHKNIFKILLITLVISMFSCLDVYAASCSTNTINNAIGIESDFDIATKTVTIKIKNNSTAKFRVIDVKNAAKSSGTNEIVWKQDPNKPKVISNRFEADGYYYKIDGNDAILDKNHPLVLNVANSGLATISLGLVNKKATANCEFDTWEKYNSELARDKDPYEEWETKTYIIPDLIIDIPNFDTGVRLYDNPNYNKICTVIRTGNNYYNKIDKTILSYYENTTEAHNHYDNILQGACNEKTDVVYSENQLKLLIEAALISYHNSKDSGVETGDGTTESWSIDFYNTCIAAFGKNNLYYADNISENKYKLYKLTGFGNLSAQEFCSIKWKDSNIVPTKTGNEIEKFNLKCKAISTENDFSDLAEHIINKDGKRQYNIDANSEYYYAINVSEGQATYTYNYTGTDASHPYKTVKENVNVCKRYCEEVVEVKYGPPVASKAGLCFEYQIQVTSRVKCQAKITAQPPKRPSVCNPVPYCNNRPGYQHQAGPNSEFEECINSCDGGKYTKSCSDKCYKKVYSDSKGIIKNGNNDLFDLAATKVVNNSALCWNDEYTRNASGVIGVPKGNCYARYYYQNEYNRTVNEHGSYIGGYLAVDGFKKLIKSYRANGGYNYCTENCKFYGCSEETYLNESDIARDYAENVKEYQSAIAKCDASASCTTKSAVFKISVDYLDENKNKQTIEFPYTSSDHKETLVSDSDASKCNKLDITKGDHILLAYHGCYDGCGNQKQYHARWSFPGTWVASKSGEISYKPQTDVTVWTEVEDKFCIPLNAQDVNQSWWNYYYLHFIDEDGNTSLNDTTIVTKTKECKKSLEENNIIRNPNDLIDWNIHGSTKDFGYFGWNIKISCFYALNSKGVTTQNNSTTTDIACSNDPQTSYRVRSVDLDDLFPSTDGSQTSGIYGRTPGFNWSTYANNNKNADYISYPEKYANEVQNIKYTVYSDEYLDYEFNLTREDLKAMRNKIKNNPGSTKYNNYGNNSDNYSSDTGVTSYRSKLFRVAGDEKILDPGKGSKNGDGVIPNDSVLGCNNIDKYSSTKCKTN